MFLWNGPHLHGLPRDIVAERSHDPFAIVTGASTGIGLELARCCAKDGYDLLIAAESAIESAAS